MAPVRARMASRSVVLPLWKGPTSAMHRGPRGLLTSCPIAASSSGARPLIGSADADAPPVPRIWQAGKRRCAASSPRRAVAYGHCARFVASLLVVTRRVTALPSRPEFQAFQPGCDIDSDLALHTKRLQRDRILGATDQYVAADADAERRAALRAGVIAGKSTRPEPHCRRVDA